MASDLTGLQGNMLTGEWEPRAPTTGARVSDPVTSQQAVVGIVKDGTLQHKILMQVRTFDRPITDGEVTAKLEAVFSRRFQRNVVARARLELERKGLIFRHPSRVCSATGQEAVTFHVSPPHR